MTNEEAIDVIKKEAECVKRQGKTGECCRDNMGCGACDLVEKDINIFAAYFLAIEALKAQKLGEWVKIKDENGYTKFMCSNCRFTRGRDRPKYCPNCGADMRKEGKL